MFGTRSRPQVLMQLLTVYAIALLSAPPVIEHLLHPQLHAAIGSKASQAALLPKGIALVLQIPQLVGKLHAGALSSSSCCLLPQVERQAQPFHETRPWLSCLLYACVLTCHA